MSENGIYKAINNIMTELKPIPKDKTTKAESGSDFAFKYRGVDDVMNALQPLLAKHGVIIIPQVLGSNLEPVIIEKKGYTVTKWRALMQIKHIWAHTDGSFIESITVGEGLDNGDKASNKAMAIAYKYSCFQVLCIPTEEMADPDSEIHDMRQELRVPPETLKSLGGRTSSTSQNKGQEPKGNNISEAQQKRLYALCSGRSEIGKEVIKEFGYESSKDILIKDYDAICEKITVRMVRAEYEDEMSKEE